MIRGSISLSPLPFYHDFLFCVRTFDHFHLSSFLLVAFFAVTLSKDQDFGPTTFKIKITLFCLTFYQTPNKHHTHPLTLTPTPTTHSLKRSTHFHFLIKIKLKVLLKINLFITKKLTITLFRDQNQLYPHPSHPHSLKITLYPL